MVPGIYIHIPFCLSKCGYCDFYSVTSTEKISPFIKSLLKEMEMYHGCFSRFDTLYLGGGTPSLLDSAQIEEIIDGIRKHFPLSADTEVTIEANPGDLSREAAESLFKTGINRISIGIQSFDEHILSFLGRRHSSIDAISAIEHIRNAGFDNMGLDLIYGVLGQNMESWMNTLRKALSFRPEHLSCYQLTIEPSTPLGIQYRAGEIDPPDEDLLYDFFMRTSELLEASGYSHYEVSNFARGDECMSKHNRKYWDHTPYLGLGPAAHSFYGNRRWWNHRCVDRYIEEINKGIPPIEKSEILTREQLRLEALYLGLRTKMGIDMEEFSKQNGCDLLDEKGALLRTMEQEGLITITDNRLCPTRSGLLVSDSLPLL
ncbi:MAG: radical SAM family heme chaperone HemW [Deltaproteobacteria bacterium]|nr:radical SAM family heme chaperone HemW [Deltaproteobacteria bacterium]MBW2594788.1 radical SAM family heme chaperone HemW [Deltaproteobacteria bacterium]